MNTLPPVEEAERDLKDIRLELKAIRAILENAVFLSLRYDINREFYSEIAKTTYLDMVRGERLEKRILDLYPELS